MLISVRALITICFSFFFFIPPGYSSNMKHINKLLILILFEFNCIIHLTYPFTSTHAKYLTDILLLRWEFTSFRFPNS